MSPHTDDETRTRHRGRRSAPDAATSSAGAEEEPRYHTILEAIGSVAAPVSVVTALAYYIGVRRESALAGVLGIDVSVLGLSTRDYVLRSTDTLVRFLAVLFLVVMAVTASAAAVRQRLRAGPEGIRRLVAGMSSVAGSVLVVVAMYRLFQPVSLTYAALVYPVCLMAGAGMTAVGLLSWRGRRSERAAAHRRWTRAPIAVAGVGLVLVGLFWAANDYAFLQGRERGLQLQARVEDLPRVTLHSRSRLHPTSEVVEEVELTRPEGQETYRYRGLRLLLRSGSRYFLLPAEQSGQQPVMVLSEDQVDWIELTP